MNDIWDRLMEMGHKAGAVQRALAFSYIKPENAPTVVFKFESASELYSAVGRLKQSAEFHMLHILGKDGPDFAINRDSDGKLRFKATVYGTSITLEAPEPRPITKQRPWMNGEPT